MRIHLINVKVCCKKGDYIVKYTGKFKSIASIADTLENAVELFKILFNEIYADYTITYNVETPLANIDLNGFECDIFVTLGTMYKL